MFINFGEGKCPVCGDFGSEINKNTFHCYKCRTSFNSLCVFESYGDGQDKFWN